VSPDAIGAGEIALVGQNPRGSDTWIAIGIIDEQRAISVLEPFALFSRPREP